MMKVFEILVNNIAMAMRADAESCNEALPKSQRDFHAGRREGYLKNVAMIAGCEVADIRKTVLGGRVQVRKKPTIPSYAELYAVLLNDLSS